MQHCKFFIPLWTYLYMSMESRMLLLFFKVNRSEPSQMKIQNRFLCNYVHFSMIILKVNICSHPNLPFLNPECWFLNFSLCLSSCTIFTTLPGTGRRVTPCQFLHSLKSPFLGNFTNTPFFQCFLSFLPSSCWEV